MNLEFDYYLIKAVRKFPIRIVADENYGRANGVEFLYGNYKVNDNHVSRLKIVGRSPSQEEMTDHYTMAGGGSLFSSNISEIIIKERIKGIQLVESVITADNIEIQGYYVANIYQSLESFDKEKTTYDFISKQTGAWVGITKACIKPELLADIPLKDRLIYKAKEHSSLCLYHKSIVDKIMSLDPSGVKFISLEESI